jgi:hypothetical protein
MTLMATETKTATTIATQIADLAEELRSLPVGDTLALLLELSRAHDHLADVVADMPSHYPHVTARTANAIRRATGELELAIDAELNPPTD